MKLNGATIPKDQLNCLNEEIFVKDGFMRLENSF